MINIFLNVVILCAKSQWVTIYTLTPRGECSPYSINYLFFFLPPHSMLKISVGYNSGVKITPDIPWLGSGDQSVVSSAFNTYPWDCLFHTYYTLLNHHSSSLTIVVSILIQGSISILKCPQDCIYCQGPDAKCILYFLKFATFWFTTIETEGWIVDNNIEMKTSSFYTIKLAGGQDNLLANQTLDRIFQNIPPHFQIQIQFKLWTFSQYNVSYVFSFDDNQYQIEQKLSTSQKVGIQNIEIQMDHSSSQLKLKLQSISNNEHSWGLNTFDFYIAKCIIYCEKCFGPSIQECTLCIKGWMYFKDNCLPIPLILVSLIIKAKPTLQNQNQNVPFHISIDEGKKYIQDVGLNNVEIDQNFGNITFTIQANCFSKEKIEGSFKSCYQCFTQSQYTQIHYCNQNINFITYFVTFSIEIDSQLQFIINLQDNFCEAYQVIQAYDQVIEFLIFKITKSNS
ncbi:unnamed protein product [Paramecium sonneborni]|uniref:Uncharacterized protein n=1 Tax=Paramecium sonneborni TaxID=65129 RepID=A0A8S1PDQ0_9CILI|nr:unnamed protein product [Paramecium sonneborni]